MTRIDQGSPVLLMPTMSRSEAVVRHLEAGIRTGRWVPGDRLGAKDDLKHEYSVATATMNEALRVMQMNGLLDVRPGATGGVFVAEPPPFFWLGHSMLEVRGSGTTVAELLVVRDCLDQLVVADATLHRTAADIEELGVLLGEMARADNPTDALQANWALHRRIAEISPNSLVRTIYLSISDRLKDRVSTVVPEEDFADQARGRQLVHDELVSCIAAGDTAEALKVVRRHGQITRRTPAVLDTPAESPA